MEEGGVPSGNDGCVDGTLQRGDKTDGGGVWRRLAESGEEGRGMAEKCRGGEGRALPAVFQLYCRVTRQLASLCMSTDSRMALCVSTCLKMSKISKENLWRSPASIAAKVAKHDDGI